MGLSTPAQRAVLSIANQPAKIGHGGTFDASSLTWYKFRAPRINLGTVQEQQEFPRETGGPMTPTGAFKQQYYFAGAADMLPRLEGNFGYLLRAAMGTASTVTGVDADDNTVTGLNTHIFRFDPADESAQPWLAVRRLIPGRGAGNDFGETGFDCKVGMLRLTVPGKGKVATRLQILGRDCEYDDGSTWAYDNANFEDEYSTPESGNGQFAIGGEELPIVSATIDLNMMLSDPDEEAVVGQFTMDDIIVKDRSATIRIVYKYQNAELYKKVLGNSASASDWNPQPYFVDSDSGGYAFDARFSAPAQVPGTSPATNYRMRVRANKVVWAVSGPIETRPGNIIVQEFIGTVVDPNDGSDYLQIVMENGKADYTV